MNINPAADEFRRFEEKNSVPTITRTDSDGYTSEETDSDSSSKHSVPRTSNATMAAAATAPVSIPNMVFDANTGPKGVIADAQSFNRARKTSFRQTFTAMSQGFADKVSLRARSTSRPNSKSREESPGSEDEEFMKRWRQTRMAELTASQRMQTRRSSPSKRRYGRLTAVDALGYLDAVEKVTKDTIVVVLINDPESSVSSFVEDAMSNVARKYETTRFIKLSFEEAEIDPVGVPAVLAYQNGELFATIMSIVDEVPENRGFSPLSLEELLRARYVLRD